MGICRVLALIFTIAAVIFGGLQLFDHVEGARDPLTIQVLWERLDPGSLASVFGSFSAGSPWLSPLQLFLALPAWVFCLALAFLLWAVNALRGSD